MKLNTVVILPFLLTCSFFAQAKIIGSIGSGISYSDNYSLQNANYTNISQTQTTRLGSEFSGNIAWQTFDEDGGYSANAEVLMDNSTSDSSSINNLSLSLSKIKPLSLDWLARFTVNMSQYNDTTYLANSYNGYELQATLGYFGSKKQGYDFSLSLENEDHNQDKSTLYNTQRTVIKGISYLENDLSVLLALQFHDSSDNKRDATSYLVSVSKSNIEALAAKVSVSANLKSDSYVQSYSTVNSPQNSQFGGMNNFSSFQGGDTSTTNRVDSQYYINASIQKTITKQFSVSLSSNFGSYSSVTGDQDFFNLYTRIKWLFN